MKDKPKKLKFVKGVAKTPLEYLHYEISESDINEDCYSLRLFYGSNGYWFKEGSKKHLKQKAQAHFDNLVYGCLDKK